MQVGLFLQTPQAVKDFAWLRLPFVKAEMERVNEFERVYKRMVEFPCNRSVQVLHEFSLAVSEVRKLGTSGR
ncbi:MAG: hypothetical protein HY863_02275 [Chloroflexi bacterium]|nr:hypothetical protein [Chloroflexota bacterium]